jgi:hypothetical protein
MVGIDIGGVVIVATDHEDTSFWGEKPMQTPAVRDAFRVIAELERLLEGRLHLVTHAGPRIESLSRQWLQHTGFWARTGMDPARLHVVRERPHKAPVCIELGITHFVDDRVDVLAHLTTVRRRHWLVEGGEPAAPADAPMWALRSTSWAQLRRRLLADLA